MVGSFKLKENVDPSPGTLATWTLLPYNASSFRVIVSPRPVPPNFVTVS